MLHAVIKSGLLHVVVMLLVYTGMPVLLSDPPPQETVTTAMFVPIAEARNLPNLLPVVEPEPEPEPEPPEPAPAEAAPPPPTPPAPMPVVAPPPEPEPEPEPELVEVVRLPEAIVRPRPKPASPPRLDFEAALQSLDDLEPAPPTPEAETAEAAEAPDLIEALLAEADTPYRFDIPLSQTEVDAIRSQIQRNWNVPAGALGAHEMKVTLRLQLGRDGTVERVEVVEADRRRMLTDGFFRTMAESAVRAVRRTGQIKYLSPEKYEQWRDIKVTFDPKEMYG